MEKNFRTEKNKNKIKERIKDKWNDVEWYTIR